VNGVGSRASIALLVLRLAAIKLRSGDILTLLCLRPGILDYRVLNQQSRTERGETGGAVSAQRGFFFPNYLDIATIRRIATDRARYPRTNQRFTLKPRPTMRATASKSCAESTVLMT
jgi:hypothetical protein